MGLGEHDGKAKGDTTGTDIMPGSEKSRSGENYARSAKEETTSVSSTELRLDASIGDVNGLINAPNEICGTEMTNIIDQDLNKTPRLGDVTDSTAGEIMNDPS